MLPANSPFPCHWWGISLESAGLGELRPDVGTYGRYDFGRLPPLPFTLSGDFAWLATAPVHRHSIGTKYGAETAGALQFLRASSDRLGCGCQARSRSSWSHLRSRAASGRPPTATLICALSLFALRSAAAGWYTSWPTPRDASSGIST